MMIPMNFFAAFTQDGDQIVWKIMAEECPCSHMRRKPPKLPSICCSSHP